MKDSFTREDILQGLERNEFVVHYQPIIDKKNNQVVSGEALVRWQHPIHGLLHPRSFIETAERSGVIKQLGEFVLREACLHSKQWDTEGRSFFRVTVNVSLAQLEDRNFPARVKSIVQETGANPMHIAFEITETIAMEDPEHTKDMLLEIKKLGVKIALDDFGTGYSSLSHLQQFPVDVLKIDGQFIKQSLYSERDCKLMRSIILLAQALDLHVVAEGVETQEQLDLLKNLECPLMQGFYFTHALPHKEYNEWCELYLKEPYLYM